MNTENNKFTAIYIGSASNFIEKKRIEQRENETINEMLEREDVLGNLQYLFVGHPLQEGE